MKSLDFYNLIRDSFPFIPTFKQDLVLQNLSNFVLDKSNDKIFLLKGYAGTGKTSLIASLEKNLWKIKKSSVLLAPTGRAAKVISNYSSNEAQTIHKKIYVPRTDKNGKTSFVLGFNFFVAISFKFCITLFKSVNEICLVYKGSLIISSTTSKASTFSDAFSNKFIKY